MVHKMTGIAPSVAVHIPWDKPEDGDYVAFRQYAEAQGIKIGAVTPTFFRMTNTVWVRWVIRTPPTASWPSIPCWNAVRS